MSIADELQKLDELHRAGKLSDEEFARAKATALADSASPATAAPPSTPPAEALAEAKERQTRQWAMFLHLSLLAGFLVPFAGLIVPIVIWQLKKEELPGIDVHGKVVVNWIISGIIYMIASGLLIFVLIGIPLLIALCIVGVVFPIIGAIKANDGIVWKYPLTITFLK
jgi:uncharacterized protein